MLVPENCLPLQVRPVHQIVVDNREPPTPAAASKGIAALPIPPAPITATFAVFSRRCPTPPI